MSEFDRIARYFSPIAHASRALGLRDDVGLLHRDQAGKRVIVTCDAIAEGVHFLPSDPIETVARKLVRVNVSDILAKGAVPSDAVLTLGWPKSRSEAELESFSAALGQEFADWEISLIGGDTVTAPVALFASLTLMGRCIGDGPVLRSGAEAGDIVWVTGDIGAGALGLDAALGNCDVGDVARYREPKLPQRETVELIAAHATASMDVSDGLLGDLVKLMQQSGVGAHLRADQVPLFHATTERERLMRQLTGGDDYQILFATNVTSRDEIIRFARENSQPICEIGLLTEGENLLLKWGDTALELPKSLSFEHH